jgi:hypothetical protein
MNPFAYFRTWALTLKWEAKMALHDRSGMSQRSWARHISGLVVGRPQGDRDQSVFAL